MATTKRYTPGTWHLRPDGLSIVNDKQELIAETYPEGRIPYGEITANAVLIAGAPGLVDALAALLVEYRRQCGTNKIGCCGSDYALTGDFCPEGANCEDCRARRALAVVGVEVAP